MVPPDPHANLEEWSPAHRLGGRRFEPIHERQLDSALRTLAAGLPGSGSGVIVSPEFPGPEGVADLVALVGFRGSLEERLNTGLEPIESLADASVVATVAVARTTSVATISRLLGMTDRQVDRRVRDLTNRGYLERVGVGYRRCPSVRSFGRLYVFEAKVVDWRRALRQVVRYGTWSDAAGIVLLREPRDARDLKALGRALRVGVAVEDRWLVPPVLHKPNAGARLLATERIVAAVGGYQIPSAEA